MTKLHKCLENNKTLLEIISSIDEVKAINPVLLDLKGKFNLADYFIIASGSSDRHVQGISNRIASNLRDSGIKPLSVEGMNKGHWVLLDYNNILIHIFYDKIRADYNLENLWKGTEFIDISKLLNKNKLVAA